MMLGTEHEYSINDRVFTPLPESDMILESLAGRVVPEVPFGSVTLSKELQKSVIEFIPRSPSLSLFELENWIYSGIRRFYGHFDDKYTLLGLGMHPTLTLDQTAVWDHDEGEYYAAYDRLFGLRQHGWLNIQALQINIAYDNDQHMVDLFNAVRKLIPYLIALSAASPFVEGNAGEAMDNRLLFYQKNQRQIPLICHEIIPERLRSRVEYMKYKEDLYRELRAMGGDVLCEEWVASSGVIIRSTRPCIEIKALDEQECVRSDIAICAFVRALVRNTPSWLEEDRDQLVHLAQEAIHFGTARMKPELMRLYSSALKASTPEERQYLPLIENRIRNGSLAEQMMATWERSRELLPIMNRMEYSLRENRPFTNREPVPASISPQKRLQESR